MEGKSVGLKILCWSEVVISLRVLLFSLPVMIQKNSAGSLSMSNLDDRFIGLLSLTAVLYLIAGVMAIAGNKLWKAAHVLAVVVVVGATLVMARGAGEPITSANAYFASPILFAVVLTVLTAILGGTKKEA